ncbi:acyl-CoA N-acyltransferase [Multifurca ochricompacta]|uniref:Acyl-CoA N-acyltransferase n=1 Tax=Multifurca ochricompacta TaxID=376703 RepID=A0AAD4M3S8_9AGAM|nr:acyl-CoA N-acyltransferase [Multifurca ochricompacta]
MSFVNSYKAPEAPVLPSKYLGPDPYDINFSFPIDESSLESDRVKLTPFIPKLHAQEYWDQSMRAPELYRFLSVEFKTIDDFLFLLETRVRCNPNLVFFAVIDKGRGGKLAGVIGLINTEPVNLSTEIGYVVIFPAYQRTYVASNAVGILLRYCLELPTAPRPGLGLRRVQWIAHTYNRASYNAAVRMGFRYEGTLRWHWVLLKGKEGNGSSIREGDPIKFPARDNSVLSFCADDWEQGGKEHVEQAIKRLLV